MIEPPLLKWDATLTRRSFLARSLAPVVLAVVPLPAAAAGYYPWSDGVASGGTLETAILPPPGFARITAGSGSFGAWLLGLPVKPSGAPVLLFNGTEKPRQDLHVAVIAIDTGARDLQQCADAIMRLRAEWLFAAERFDDIAFNFTEGGRVPFSRWAKGERPNPSGKVWKKSASPDKSYASFRKYMDNVFAYAGTASLEKELEAVAGGELQVGDVFIKGGFPGHAVLVADLTEHAVTKAKRFLLIQSYMPAQEMHVLKNPANGDGSPWYALPDGDLVTPEWTFPKGSLKRWP
jgi:Domain of unknown function (4846)